MSNLAIKVNIYNELKKLRDDVYSPYQFIYELIQNSQRAKAERIWIEIDEGSNQVAFQDDGKGCKDLQKLFTKSETGWGKEVADVENPFGEGFFSTFAVADRMYIRSLLKEAELNIKDIVYKQQINNIKQSTCHGNFNGFRVNLFLRNDMDFDFREFKKHVRTIARFIKPKVFMNGQLIPKEEFVPKKIDNEIMIKFNEYGVEGYLKPPVRGKKVEAYYQDRFVCNLEQGDAEGRIKIDKVRGIKLKSPDRSDIIYNNAKAMVMHVLTENIKKLYVDIVKFGTDELIDELEENICFYVNDETLRKIVLVTEYGAFQDELAREQEEAENNQEDIEEENENPFNVVMMNHATADRSIDFNQVSVFKAVKKKEKGQKLGVQIEQGFWLMADEIDDNLDTIFKLRYHGVKVYIAKNKVQKKALSFLPHITKVNEEIKLQATVKKLVDNNEGLSIALAWIEEVFKLPLGTIKYGDVEFYKIIGGNKVIEPCEGFTNGIDIFIDRKSVRALKTKKFNKQMFEWIIDDSPIVHELAHLVYGSEDNTKEHFQAENVVLKRLVLAYLER